MLCVSDKPDVYGVAKFQNLEKEGILKKKTIFFLFFLMHLELLKITAALT